MPGSPFTVTPTPPTALTLRPDTEGRFSFTLTSLAAPNKVHEVTLQALLVNRDGKGEEVNWMIAEPQRATRISGGETKTVAIIVRPTHNSPRGENTIQLVIADTERPHEEYVYSSTVVCEVPGDLPPPPPPAWRIPAIVGGAALVVLGVWSVVLTWKVFGGPAKPDSVPGSSSATPAASCKALLDAGVARSDVYWVTNPTSADASKARQPMRVYCDQEISDGGWALVYSSVIGPGTLDFWNIPYAQRFDRRGRPTLDSNYYDGSLYQTSPASYLDVAEDLGGKIAIMFVATSTGINSENMRFNNPVRVSGNPTPYDCHFASGWSAPDRDGDTYDSNNCATNYNNVTQHYCGCWNYNLGSDADISGGDTTDQRLGPHVHVTILTSLGLVRDGSDYGRVRAIRRYVKW